MTISIILDKRGHDTITATPDMTVADAVKILADKRIGALPVVEGDVVVGVMSERDLVYCAAKEGAAALDRPVRDVMTAEPITVQRNHSILGALGLMTDRRVRHLPVVEDGRLVGFISIGDLVKHKIDEVQHEAEALRNYIQAV